MYFEVTCKVAFTFASDLLITQIVKAETAFFLIRFFEVGAFVWFTHIIDREFPRFTVMKCYNQILHLQSITETIGKLVHLANS